MQNNKVVLGITLLAASVFVGCGEQVSYQDTGCRNSRPANGQPCNTPHYIPHSTYFNYNATRSFASEPVGAGSHVTPSGTVRGGFGESAGAHGFGGGE